MTPGAQQIMWMAGLRAEDRWHQRQVWKKWPGHFYQLGFSLPAHTTAKQNETKQCQQDRGLFLFYVRYFEGRQPGTGAVPPWSEHKALSSSLCRPHLILHMMLLEPKPLS